MNQVKFSLGEMRMQQKIMITNGRNMYVDIMFSRVVCLRWSGRQEKKRYYCKSLKKEYEGHVNSGS